MAITTSFLVTQDNIFDVAAFFGLGGTVTARSNPEIFEISFTALSPFGVLGDDGTSTALAIFDADRNAVENPLVFGSLTNAAGSSSFGSRLIAGQDADSVVVVNFTGTPSSLDVGTLGSANPDIAILGFNRYALAFEDPVGAGNSDILISFRNISDHSVESAFHIAASADNDRDVKLARLDNGNVAVVWERTLAGGNTQVWLAVYDSNGGVVKAPTPISTTVTVQSAPDIIAIEDGGFAIAFETNLFDSVRDIAVIYLTADGTPRRVVNASPNDANFGGTLHDTSPSLASLGGDVLAVTYTRNAFPDGDNLVSIIDQDGMVFENVYNVLAGEGISDNVAAPRSLGLLGDSRVAVVQRNVTDDDLDGEILNVTRVVSGDGADDVYLSSGFVNQIINGGGGNDFLKGAQGDDVITGGEGNDWLDGGSEFTSVDTYVGGNGNDTYVLWSRDIASFVITELAGGGIDVLRSSISRSLTPFANVERLMLLGAGNIDATGNALDNVLWGNTAANKLDGLGGSDSMIGGNGNDTYVVERSSDAVVETNASTAGGIDRILSIVTRTLGANVEQLVLLGSGNIHATGNELANYLVGNAGNNVITGHAGGDRIIGGAGNDYITGGVGVDVLTGGAGFDNFVFNTASPSVNRDIITDFFAPQDTIRLENAIFTALGPATGFLTANKFWSSSTGVAHDADDRIVYNTTTGALIYDVNGSGAGGAFQFATLSSKPAIGAADFFVV